MNAKLKEVFEIKDLVWFLFGWLVPQLCSIVNRLVSEKRFVAKVKNVANYIEMAEDIVPIDHGLPFYSERSLTLESPDSTKSFHFVMPSDKHQRLCEANPDFEHTEKDWYESTSYWGSKDDNYLLDAIVSVITDVDKEQLRRLLEEKKNEIADLFLRRANEPFFNGEMYGIMEMKSGRDKEERPKFLISSFKTDYYTHRVMASMYHELLSAGKLKAPRCEGGLDEINRYFPFMTSMGMDVLLIIEARTKIVLVKRSRKLINMDRDLWHVSANEAISITADKRLEEIDLNWSVARGLKEELGLDVKKRMDFQIFYSDVFFFKDPFEVAFSAFAIADCLTEADVRNAYNTAQDAPFESTGNERTGLMFLPFSDKAVNKFCKKNKLTSTPTLRFLLKMLMIKKGHLPLLTSSKL